MQLWVETGDLKELAPTLEKMPFDFVIDHMGRTMADKGVDTPGFRDFCEKLKTGATGASSRAPTATPARAPGRGRPMTTRRRSCRRWSRPIPTGWSGGSDWPHVGHGAEAIPQEEDLLGLFFRCVPDEAVRRKILVDNPKALYGF